MEVGAQNGASPEREVRLLPQLIEFLQGEGCRVREAKSPDRPLGLSEQGDMCAPREGLDLSTNFVGHI